MVGGTHFNRDGYWHLGLVVRLFSAPNEYPHQLVLIELCLTEEDGRVMVKLGADGKPRELDLTSEVQCKQFYDEIADTVANYFNAKRDFGDTGTIKKIGFNPKLNESSTS